MLNDTFQRRYFIKISIDEISHIREKLFRIAVVRTPLPGKAISICVGIKNENYSGYQNIQCESEEMVKSQLQNLETNALIISKYSIEDFTSVPIEVSEHPYVHQISLNDAIKKIKEYQNSFMLCLSEDKMLLTLLLHTEKNEIKPFSFRYIQYKDFCDRSVSHFIAEDPREIVIERFQNLYEILNEYAFKSNKIVKPITQSKKVGTLQELSVANYSIQLCDKVWSDTKNKLVPDLHDKIVEKHQAFFNSIHKPLQVFVDFQGGISDFVAKNNSLSFDSSLQFIQFYGEMQRYAHQGSAPAKKLLENLQNVVIDSKIIQLSEKVDLKNQFLT